MDPAIGQRIDSLREERGLEPKHLYAALGWDKGKYSRKMRGLTQVFADEAARVAKILDAPRGWPYISVEEGLLLEALGERVSEVLRSLPEILELLSRRRT